MSTDVSKLATELQKKFPGAKPNGTYAPPPNVAPAIPPTGDVYQICGINKLHKD
jgi:hypothetical protein